MGQIVSKLTMNCIFEMYGVKAYLNTLIFHHCVPTHISHLLTCVLQYEWEGFNFSFVIAVT